MKEIRQLAVELHAPIAVAYIPSRQEMLFPKSPSNIERTRQFSEILGATFFDGREAFAGLSRGALQSDWYVSDFHWNRGGSDQFANFMAKQIPGWLAAHRRDDERESRVKQNPVSTTLAFQLAESAVSRLADTGLH
jgi:hypothetical protein